MGDKAQVQPGSQGCIEQHHEHVLLDRLNFSIHKSWPRVPSTGAVERAALGPFPNLYNHIQGVALVLVFWERTKIIIPTLSQIFHKQLHALLRPILLPLLLIPSTRQQRVGITGINNEPVVNSPVLGRQTVLAEFVGFCTRQPKIHQRISNHLRLAIKGPCIVFFDCYCP